MARLFIRYHPTKQNNAFTQKTFDKMIFLTIFVSNKHKIRDLSMFERLKVKMAARRAERAKRARRNSRNRRPGFWARVWNIICWPFRKIWQFICWLWRLICRFFRWLWRLICGINVIGLLNIVLLVAIIVLCAMLIIDIINCTRKPTIIVADPVPASALTKVVNVPVVAEPVTKPVSTTVTKTSVVREPSLKKTVSLPIARTKSHKMGNLAQKMNAQIHPSTMLTAA